MNPARVATKRRKRARGSVRTRDYTVGMRQVVAVGGAALVVSGAHVCRLERCKPVYHKEDIKNRGNMRVEK
jgi:hypothetical protein